MKLHRRIAAVVIAALCATAIAGCSQLPFHDDSYKTRIPAALEAADIGISNAWAGISLDGFTETLTVGGTVEATSKSGQVVSPQFVRRIIVIALAHTSAPTQYFEIALRDGKDKMLDVAPALTDLGATPRGDGSITTDQAEKIAREGAE